MWLAALLACAAAPSKEIAHLPVRLATPVVLAKDLGNLTDVQAIPGHAELVVLSKDGRAQRVSWPEGPPRPWFEVDVRTESELGLLGIAFPPDFATTGRFVVYDTPKQGAMRSVVSLWRCDPATLEGPTRLRTLLEVAQPYPNHNGGQVRFDGAGLLYIGLGDGGAAGDPLGSGQDTTTLLGSILRIDPSSEPYGIPEGNPFANSKKGKPEIWAFGLRNPWRFDLLPDGRAIIGDVGQNEVEEVTIGGAGANHGWKTREGDRCYSPKKGCSRDGLTEPVFTYTHDIGQSITGGVVPSSGPFAGHWLFGDFASGQLFAHELTAHQTLSLGKHALNPTAFARAPDGTALVADYGGTLYRLTGD